MGGDGPHGGIHNMNIKSNEKKENSTIELVIQVGADEFNAAIDKVYNRQKKNITLPGLTGATQYSTPPLPEPIRASAG